MKKLEGEGSEHTGGTPNISMGLAYQLKRVEQSRLELARYENAEVGSSRVMLFERPG